MLTLAPVVAVIAPACESFRCTPFREQILAR